MTLKRSPEIFGVEMEIFS